MSIPIETPSYPKATDPTPRRPHRRWAIIAGAVAAVAAAGAVTAALVGGDDDASDPPLALNLPGDAALASCVVFDVEFLAPMPIAFEGRAVEVADETVTLDVTRWYRGGDTEQVTLSAPTGMQALIDGFDFVEGTDYLVSASEESQVNFCGFSGPATEELRAAYATAFAG